ncbi:MAG TPA: diacylglycerol kinase family protein [Anaerolineae bacterium]
MELVADIWRSRGWQVDIQPTRAPGHATELARQAADAGRTLVMAAGGDGTLGDVADGLVGTETIMAPLPVGTANSFGKELLMPRPTLLDKRHKLFQAASSLAAGRVHRVDLGFACDSQGRGRHWLLWAGAGADGFLVDELEPRPKWSKKLGSLGYFLQGLVVAPQFPHMMAHVSVDGRVFEDELLLVVISNCRLYAGGELVLSPQARMDDGLFEVWLFRGHGLSRILRYLVEARVGRHRSDPGVTLVHGRHITIQTDPVMPCQTDGERAGRTPLSCQIKPGALRLLVPETAPNDLFTEPGEALIP